MIWHIIKQLINNFLRFSINGLIKKYKLQILKYSIYYIIIIATQDAILMAKI